MRRGLGHIPSPADDRDLSVSFLLGTANRVTPPLKSDGLRGYLGALLDQEDTEGCCGWSFVNGLWSRWNYLAALKGRPGPLAQPSPAWAWWAARKVDGNERLNIGTYVRNVYRQARALGVPQERFWSSVNLTRSSAHDGLVGVPGFAEQPDQLAFTAAYDQRFPLSYYRVDLESDRKLAFQRAIANGYPVQFGTLVTRAFQQLGRHDPQPVPSSDAEFAGGHSLTALYYDERGVYGPNNWTIGWGNSGWFALSWDYILWSRTSDCWAIDCGLPGKGWN